MRTDCIMNDTIQCIIELGNLVIKEFKTIRKQYKSVTLTIANASLSLFKLYSNVYQ